MRLLPNLGNGVRVSDPVFTSHLTFSSTVVSNLENRLRRPPFSRICADSWSSTWLYVEIQVNLLIHESNPDTFVAARLIRLTLLAPDIVEAILMGEEPSGLSLTMLTKQLPLVWNEQRMELGTL